MMNWLPVILFWPEVHAFGSLRSYFSSLKCNLSENSIRYFRNLELSPCLSSLSHLFYHLHRSTICTRPLPRTKWIQMVRVPRTSHFRSQSIRMSTSVNPTRMFAQSILNVSMNRFFTDVHVMTTIRILLDKLLNQVIIWLVDMCRNKTNWSLPMRLDRFQHPSITKITIM